MTIGAEDFVKHGSEACFKSFGRDVGTDANHILSQVLRRLSNTLEFNASELKNESAAEPNDSSMNSTFFDDTNELVDIAESDNNADVNDDNDNDDNDGNDANNFATQHKDAKKTKGKSFESSKGFNAGQSVLSETTLNGCNIIRKEATSSYDLEQHGTPTHCCTTKHRAPLESGVFACLESTSI